MNNGICSKGYYLSLQEFLIFLYKKQITGLSFPNEIVDVEANDRQLKEAMNELVNFRFLEPDGDNKFLLSKEMERVMTILNKAGETITVSSQSSMMPMIYMYSYEGSVLSVQLDKNRKGWLRIQGFSNEEAIKYILEYAQPIIVSRYKRGETCCEEFVYNEPKEEDLAFLFS